MKINIGRFLIIGYIFAFLVEAINLGFGQGDWLSILYLVLFVYSIFIFLSYFAYYKGVSKLLHILIFGLLGLQVEWLIFQNNPFAGNIVLLFLMNISMFGHWATIAFAPRLLLDSNVDQNFKKKFTRLYFFGIIISFGLSYFYEANYTLYLIGTVILYVLLSNLYIKYFKM